MSSKRWLAIVLSTVLSISACLPVSAISTYAADVGSTQEAVTVEAVDAAAFGDEAVEEAAAMTAVGETGEEETAGTSDDMEAGTAEPSDVAASDDGDAGRKAVSEDESTEESSDEETAPAEAAVGQEAGPAQDAAYEERMTMEEEGAPESAGETGEDSDSPADSTGTEGEPVAPAGTEEETADLVEDAEDPGKEQVQTPARAAAAEDFANAVELTETSPVQVEVTEEAPCAYLKFTPGEDSGYTIYALSEENYDTYGTLYDESYEKVTYNDDGGEDNNFRIRYVLEAGHTYYLEARQYNYGNAVFTVYVEKNSFTASRVGERSVTAAPGEEVTFSVVAASDSTLHYQWFRDDEELEGETKAQYTVVADGYHYIYCNVWDDNGEGETISFDLNVENHLQAFVAGTEDTGTDIYAKPGETVELGTDVSADNETGLSFRWYKNEEEIEGAAGKSWTIDAVTEYAEYTFQVFDKYGNSAAVFFLCASGEPSAGFCRRNRGHLFVSVCYTWRNSGSGRRCLCG